MTSRTREGRLSSVFLQLADSHTVLSERLDALVAVCAEIFEVDAAGIVLVDEHGELRPATGTDVRATLVEIVQLNAGSGPGLQSFESGLVVSVAQIDESGALWPRFREGALQQGYRSVHVIPLRLRGTAIGTLSLWSSREGALPDRDAEAAKALAEMATLAILNEQLVRERSTVIEQLQRALENRVLVEQAKGVLSQAWSIDVDDAYHLMRTYARSRSMPVHALAASIVDRSLDLEVIRPAATVQTR